MQMTSVSASKKMIDVHRSAMDLVEKAKAKTPWDETDCEVLAQTTAPAHTSRCRAGPNR